VSVPASRPVRVGLALFAAGLVFIAIDVLPFFGGRDNTPLWLNLACLLAPLGFAVAIGSAVRAGRAQQRAALAELADRGRIH
jgi:uncharacterized membrane protein YhdT